MANCSHDSLNDRILAAFFCVARVLLNEFFVNASFGTFIKKLLQSDAAEAGKLKCLNSSLRYFDAASAAN
jgi:hypothetical protein